jgi:formylglycine-generating enzyme required for sulfatase activity
MSESQSNSSLTKLLDYLDRTGVLKRLQFSDEDLADSIWLALQMGGEDFRPPKNKSDKRDSPIPIERREDIKEDTSQKSAQTIDIIPEDSSSQETEKSTLTQGFPFQVPAAPALQTALPISRALRPLTRKVPSATKTLLDEEATATRIAERDIWLPVAKPQPERWLNLELVIEESRSSFIWRELVNDLQQLLENQGAFKTIRVWQLSTPDNQKLHLVRRRKKGKSGQRYHPHRELIHPSGRGLVLLVSDCVSPIWQNALIHPWLKEWSEEQPTAIIQLFPERLWNSTQLGRGRKLFTSALTPGVPNPKLVLKNYPKWLPIDWQKTLLIPVVTLEAEVLKQWGRVIAGGGQAQISAFLFDLNFIKPKISGVASEISPNPPSKGGDSEEDKEDGNTIKEQAEAIVERFFATASEPAKNLAAMVAAAPISMPVINLIRKTLLNEVRPVHVAEFYMGGLLKPIVENEEGQYRVYDFLPGVRKVLNESIGSRKTTKVLDAISQYIAAEIKSPIRSFAALLTLLPQYSEEQQEKILPFAQVAVDVLQNLGGEYAEFAEEVAVNISRRDRPSTSEAEKTAEPTLKTCTFEVATLEILETRTFEFIVATIERQSQRGLVGLLPGQEKWVIKRQKRQAEGMIEELSEEVQLELMEIPGGTFMMGSPQNKPQRFDNEEPQHQVTIAPFYMGRYPITQKQWRAIASRTDLKVEIDLKPDPSSFKGDERPVEQVNWYEALEFCARLSKLTRWNYRLPTEAEWEYACRAGTTTPFHFGETITGELANYRATETYADEPKGEYRQKTTTVGYFKVANTFGLYDMHGNVYEWCEDDYHSNYEGAPRDGSAWISNDKYTTKIPRGGSWFSRPDRCRSASRYISFPRDDSNDVGFRVVCSAPRTL